MTLWWLLSNSHNIHCAKSEEKKCPKPVISNVDVSTNKIYFSAPNAYTVAVSSSSDKIKWTSGHGWPESPRSITYLQHYIKITSLCKGWESESDIFEVTDPIPSPEYHGKIDRNGNPFEWEKYMIYMEWWDKKPVKLGPLQAVRTGNRIWDREDNREYGIAPWNVIVSWISNSGGRRPKLYMPYNSNHWIAFEIEPWSSWKITRTYPYIKLLEK